MISGFLRSIRNKLLLLVLIANLSALLVAGGALIYNEVVEYRQGLIDELNTQADILGQASAAALDFNDAKAAEENLAQLRAQPKVLAAAIASAAACDSVATTHMPKLCSSLVIVRPARITVPSRQSPWRCSK
jgi:hypothetical protein